MSSASSVDFIVPTAFNFLTSGQRHRVWVFIFLIWIASKMFLVIKLSGFAELFTFSTSAPVVSVLADRHIKERHY